MYIQFHAKLMCIFSKHVPKSEYTKYLIKPVSPHLVRFGNHCILSGKIVSLYILIIEIIETDFECIQYIFTTVHDFAEQTNSHTTDGSVNLNAYRWYLKSIFTSCRKNCKAIIKLELQ